MSPAQTDMSDRTATIWRVATWAARLVLAGVLLAAAIPKLADPAAFAAKLPNYRLFPDFLVNLVATTAPMLELVAALALLSGRLYRGGVWLSLGLMAMFTAMIGSALARGIDLDCGCFGAATTQADPVGALELVRNIVLLGLATLLAVDLERRP